jgi:hypothetical protein
MMSQTLLKASFNSEMTEMAFEQNGMTLKLAIM